MYDIDMQNAFMLPGVAFAVIETAQEIVPNINRLADAVRSAGGTVVWIKMTYGDDEPVDWSAFYRLVTPELGARRRAALTKGSEGHQIWKDLDVHPDRHGRRPASRLVAHPLLRRAVASPLMVSRMPRLTSSSVSPER
jgi:nicotinamidase-related amidase